MHYTSRNIHYYQPIFKATLTVPHSVLMPSSSMGYDSSGDFGFGEERKATGPLLHLDDYTTSRDFPSKPDERFLLVGRSRTGVPSTPRAKKLSHVKSW